MSRTFVSAPAHSARPATVQHLRSRLRLLSGGSVAGAVVAVIRLRGRQVEQRVLGRREPHVLTEAACARHGECGGNTRRHYQARTALKLGTSLLSALMPWTRTYVADDLRKAEGQLRRMERLRVGAGNVLQHEALREHDLRREASVRSWGRLQHCGLTRECSGITGRTYGAGRFAD